MERKSTFKKITTSLIAVCLMTIASTAIGQNSADKEPTFPGYDIRGFVQQQFFYDEMPGVPAQFTMYRARVGVDGALAERIRVNVTGGFVEPPQNTPRLVQAFMDYRVNNYITLRAGQFLIPFGLEGPEVITLNPAIERSLAIRRLNTFSLFRDVGVQAGGNISRFNYAIAIVNGTGGNQPEQMNPKDITGRFGFQLSENFEAGISGHFGNYYPNQEDESYESRYRLGIDLNFTGDPFFVRGEYIQRTDNLPNSSEIKMYGGYLLAGYSLSQRLEGITRYEFYKPNSDLDDNLLQAYTIGANYYFVRRTRLSVNYEFRNNELNPDFGNLFTVQLQVVL
ncbi:MAG: hypothetical protein EA391_11695 [Balneolaceae bacterium]|nr:MAG: hypothetical protein EA391_11695 [Balneolaceae bacterium]